MKCNCFSFNLVLFVSGLQLVSRSSVFTILHFYEVYLPLINVKLVSSAHLSMR